MFKNALVSVSDKTGLIEFLKPLVKEGLRVVSTGGTYQYLKDNGIPAVDVQAQTGFPEVMDGRVKTLHPKVHMPLLARDWIKEDMEILKKEELAPFDLVIVNLYPFEASLEKNLSKADMIEKIDIGGPSLLRAASKNFGRICVLCDPKDYPSVLEKRNSLTVSDRQKFAAKVFSHVARYDSLISHWLNSGSAVSPPDEFWGEEFSLGGARHLRLRYGENPDQQAAWYRISGIQEKGLQGAHTLQGKALSYNNLLDLDAATALVACFSQPTAVGVKHNNPCGVASDLTVKKAIEKMAKSDPVSIFGGIVALNGVCDADSAELLNAVFLECVIAPDFSSEALKIFSAKKNLRVLKWPQLMNAARSIEMKSIAGGFLLQTPDKFASSTEDWKVVSGDFSISDLPPEIMNDLCFAEKICASLKSNAIAIVKAEQSIGLGMGQVNRVEAVQHAIDRMKTHHGYATKTVLASDAFFPFPDSIVKAAEAGISWILQPGGSMKDAEVIAEAQKQKINMVFTGKRHFKH